VRLVEERRSFKSGIEAHEAMLKAAAEDCPRRLRAQAEEELERLKDGAYRNEAMWTIPYRLLPLALTLPAIGCRIEGQTRRDGRTIRHVIC
jgi:hypothetical protein